MELMTVLLLLLAGWTQHSGATNCSVYLSSQPLTLNLLCPNAMCRLEMHSMRGCNNGCPSCNFDDCNRVYNLCDITQSVFNTSNEFSPQQLPNNWQINYSNVPPINCTIVEFSNPGLLMVTCQKEECILSFETTNTACNRDLNDHCNQRNQRETCIRMYNFCMEPQPNTCPSRQTVTTTALNQCTNSVTTQTHTEVVTVTIHSQTTVQMNVYLSPTISQILGRTNVLANTSYPLLPTHTPAPELCTSTVQVFPLNRAIPATGALVGLLTVLLVVVTTGWIYTCRRKKILGLRSQNISLNNNPAYETETILQQDLAYEVTSISMGEPEVATNQLEPVYEIVQLASTKINTIEKISGSVK